MFVCGRVSIVSPYEQGDILFPCVPNQLLTPDRDKERELWEDGPADDRAEDIFKPREMIPW